MCVHSLRWFADRHAGSDTATLRLAFRTEVTAGVCLDCQDARDQASNGRSIRAVSLRWCLGILYSTLAVSQHILWEVIAGAVLGVVVALVQGALIWPQKWAVQPLQTRAGEPQQLSGQNQVGENRSSSFSR